MSDKKLIPLGDRVIIEPLSVEQTSSSGIILPTEGKEQPGMGTIIAIGPGSKNEKGELVPVNVEIGNVVVFSKYIPEEVELDGKKYFVLKEESLLAVIK